MFAIEIWPWLSALASAALVLTAMAWVWRSARRLTPGTRDAATARRMAWLFALGALAWLAYALHAGYARLWQADAFLIFAQQNALLGLPFLIGGLAWVAALMLGRVFRLLAASASVGR
ncbi:hypothetical protein [Comamonas composti]|uniref:hypothetical protein n=1 Tax=Comamonas composti TaxID=408558 RepID=UPI000411F068|nr:hypothetical protein [Comamonas composti]